MTFSFKLSIGPLTVDVDLREARERDDEHSRIVDSKGNVVDINSVRF
jgi:hypothetical protein